MSTTITPDKTLDARGIACALVMAKTKMTLQEMEPGMILEILTTDVCTEFDLPAWSKVTGRDLISTIKEQDVIKFYIRKS